MVFAIRAACAPAALGGKKLGSWGHKIQVLFLREGSLGSFWSTEEAVTGGTHAGSTGSHARGLPVGGGST